MTYLSKRNCLFCSISLFLLNSRQTLGNAKLLTKSEVSTVSNGHLSTWKKRWSVTYREDEVSKIVIIYLYCVSGGFQNDLFTRNGFKLLKHVESKTSQFETAVKLRLAHFNTQFKVKENFRLLLTTKVKNTWWQITRHLGNRNSLKF